MSCSAFRSIALLLVLLVRRGLSTGTGNLTYIRAYDVFDYYDNGPTTTTTTTTSSTTTTTTTAPTTASNGTYNGFDWDFDLSFDSYLIGACLLIAFCLGRYSKTSVTQLRVASDYSEGYLPVSYATDNRKRFHLNSECKSLAGVHVNLVKVCQHCLKEKAKDI
jgi:hypothetical protein